MKQHILKYHELQMGPRPDFGHGHVLKRVEEHFFMAQILLRNGLKYLNLSGGDVEK